MKKDTLRGIIALAVILILYILIAFLIPFEHTPVFWASFIFTLVAFAVVTVSIYIAFVKQPDAKSRFYGFPIAKIGVIYGAIQLVVSIIFMALGDYIATWLAVLVYAIGMGVAVIGLIAAEAVADTIQGQETKTKNDVYMMRALQSKVYQLAAQCDEAAIKALAEEIRYSDPVSNEAFVYLENDLSAGVYELQDAVLKGDREAVRQICSKVSVLLEERNRLSKLYKK